MSPNKAKVFAISNGNEMMRLQLSKPCENLFVNPILTNLVNLTKNCIVKKGHYKFSLNYEEILRAYYGGLHLYGLYTFKSILYGDQCNFSCTIIEVQISRT
ncbi:uncharacterized protein LOC118265217 [Spodoptera frugiperda]|nr:uncharacterized protein LOC118265217 [Spodoptera frugiperda]